MNNTAKQENKTSTGGGGSRYEIEYTDQGVLNNAFFVSLALFFSIETFVICLIDNQAALTIGVLAGMLLPFVYFLWKKRKAKQYGYILVSQHRLVFGIFGQEKSIDIQQIRQYRITHYNGVSIVLILHGGERFTLIANANFCQSDQLQHTCLAIQETIRQHGTDNPTAQSPSRAKTIFERTWFIIGLTVISLALLGVTVYAIALGRPFYLLLVPMAIFSTFWLAVYRTRG